MRAATIGGRVPPGSRSAATLTNTIFMIPHLTSARFFALVTEDAAGNRSQPVLLEGDVGKVDVVVVVDNSATTHLDDQRYHHVSG